MDRFKEQDEKIDESADFRTVFMGATKILAWIVVVGAGIAGIYVAIHSGSGGAHP